MVEQKAELDLVFRAISDPTRRAMLDSLRGGERSIVELAEPFQMSLAGAAKHVQVLARANLITRRKEGRTHFCQINHLALKEAFQWLEQHQKAWNQRLDRLESLLLDEKKRGEKK